MEKCSFKFTNSLLGIKDCRFIFLKLGSEKTLGFGKRLLANIVIRYKAEISLRYLNIVAKNLIKAYLQRFNPRLFPFLALQVSQLLLGILRRQAEAIKFLGKTLPDYTTLTQRRGRRLLYCLGN